MAAIHKFLFEKSFDDPDMLAPKKKPKTEAPVVDEPEEPVVPTVTMTEEEFAAKLKEVEEEAYLRGKTEVEDAQSRSIEDEIAAALRSISIQLPDIAAKLGPEAEMRSGDAVLVAASVARKLLPEKMAEGAIEEIEGLVRSTVSGLINEPRVVVRANPEIAEGLRERLAEVATETGFDGKLTIVDDEKQPVGNCHMEWSDGGAERDVERMLNDLDGLIDRYREAQEAARIAAEEEAAALAEAEATAEAEASADEDDETGTPEADEQPPGENEESDEQTALDADDKPV